VPSHFGGRIWDSDGPRPAHGGFRVRKATDGRGRRRAVEGLKFTSSHAAVWPATRPGIALLESCLPVERSQRWRGCLLETILFWDESFLRAFEERVWGYLA
jgi:hypothetical protein